MKIRDLMTSNPVCCTPNDTVARAAQIMRNEDVGPVPIVADQMDRRLIGIVTDRDIVIKAVADGQNPNTTRLEAVMSRSLVTGSPDEDVEDALQRMSDNQIRRLPIVDRSNCLIGIVSQADLARNVDRNELGDMVSEVSESSHFHLRNPFARRAQGRTDRWMPQSSFVSRREGERIEYGSGGDSSSLLIGAACLAAGAAVMYLLDPARGGYRRGVVRDKAVSLYNTAGDVLGQTTRDLGNRASGLVSQARNYVRSDEPVTDETLLQRVRSHMGHEVSHPHAIDISVRDGCVVLQGPILASEVDTLISCVRSIPGVRNVESRLEVHPAGDNNPSLQGGREFTRR